MLAARRTVQTHHPGDKPVARRVLFALTQPVLFPTKKGETHGTRKTRHQASCTAQEVPQEDKRLFPHQKQALPICAGSRQSRRSLRQARPPRQKARVSQALDSARRSRRTKQRPDLWPVDSRPQGCRRQSRPQNPSGYRGERRRGIHIARGDSESRRSTASQSEKSVLAKIVAPPSLSALFSRGARYIVPFGVIYFAI